MLRASERRIKINARERRGRECEEKKGEHQRGQCPLIVGPTPKKPRVEHPQDHLGSNTTEEQRKKKRRPALPNRPEGRLLHFPADRLLITCYAGMTVEPTRSPRTARRMLPDWFMLKTTMGMPLSMQREMAVASMTLRFWCRTSR